MSYNFSSVVEPRAHYDKGGVVKGALSKLVDAVKYYNTLGLNAADRSTLLQQRNNADKLLKAYRYEADAASPEQFNEFDRLAHANGNIKNVLTNGLNNRQWQYDDQRMLTLPYEGEPNRAGAAMLYSLPGERIDPSHDWAPITNGGLYVDLFGSGVPGYGKATMKALTQRYPDTPITLLGDTHHGADEVYRNWGFRDAPPDADPSGSSLPFLFLERGRDLKFARGGLARYMEACNCGQ